MPRGTYAQNNSVSYNRSVIKPTQRFYMNSNPDGNLQNSTDDGSFYTTVNYRTKPTTNQQSQFEHLLTGGNAAGNVWINSAYNVEKESPGLSWTL